MTAGQAVLLMLVEALAYAVGITVGWNARGARARLARAARRRRLPVSKGCNVCRAAEMQLVAESSAAATWWCVACGALCVQTFGGQEPIEVWTVPEERRRAD